jgi:hypothetical protein
MARRATWGLFSLDNQQGQEPGAAVGQEPPRPESTQQQQGSAAGGASAGQEPETYDRAYVERLRAEAAKNRVDAKELREAKAKLDEIETNKLGEIERRDKQIADLKAQVAEVETVRQRADRLEAALTAHLAAQRKGIEDKGVLELLDKLDPVDQLEWIAKHGATAAGGQRPGIPASPRPNGHRPEQKADLAYDRMKAAGLGRGF